RRSSGSSLSRNAAAPSGAASASRCPDLRSQRLRNRHDGPRVVGRLRAGHDPQEHLLEIGLGGCELVDRDTFGAKRGQQPLEFSVVAETEIMDGSFAPK